MQYRYLLLVILSFYSTLLFSQRFIQKANLTIGRSVISELLPEGVTYEPFVILGSYQIFERKNFSIYTEAQLTFVHNQLLKQPEYEFGLNAGIAYKIPFNQTLFLRGAIGAGPHYISMETRRQANGFIFSDNFELGLHKAVNNVWLSVRARFRHISNAGLKKPNGGIDNLILLIGVGGNLAY